MLFKNYIYVNEELLQKLSKQLGIKMSHDITKVNQINKKAGIGLSSFSAGAENIKTDTENVKNDKYDLLGTFEKEIDKDETGIIDFDFDEADHIFAGQLIQFTAKILQPKSGDENIELVHSIKQNPIFSEMLKNSVNNENSNDQKIIRFII